jgi:lincosamide nucleotidyltransferase
MLIQETMIERVRQLCRDDARVIGAFMYGSFTLDEGDRYSDIEFYIYMDEVDLATLDERGWLAQVAPLALYFTNELGTGTAIFDNLVRGEFHFASTVQMAAVRAAKASGGRFPEPERMLVVDRTGQLREHLAFIAGSGPERATPESLAGLWQEFLNWMLFGANVLARGERARALEILDAAQRHLLWLARIQAGCTDHWPTPSRAAEHDLPPEHYARFAACTAGLAPGALEAAYSAAWAWGVELARALSAGHPFETYSELMKKMEGRFEVRGT